MIDIEIDKLTNSVEEVATGRSFDTSLARASNAEIRGLGKGWLFDWRKEATRHEVFELTIPVIGAEILGLISIENMQGFILVPLVESAPHNLGKHQKYVGVGGNLMAYAAKVSIEAGFRGFVAFDPKTALMQHYATKLKAVQVGSSQRMVIYPDAARDLVAQYFGDEHGTPA